VDTKLKKDKRGRVKGMKWKGVSKVLSAMAISTLLLSACGGGGETKPTTNKPTEEKPKAENLKFQTALKNDKEEVKDGSLTYGVVSTSPLEGIFHPSFYGISTDSEVLSWFYNPLLEMDSNFQFTNDGAATYEVSADKKTITLKIRDNVNWHDGAPVTAEDLEYSYKVIAHKDYKGVRFAGIMRKIVGIDKYNKGETDKIEGIKIIDPKTLSITYTEADPGITSGVWSYPTHKKIFEKIPIAKQAESPEVRQNPIGFGPFKVKKVVPGEAVEFERYDKYWKGTPKLKNVVAKVVSPSTVAASLKNGEVDLINLTEEQYSQVEGLKNTQIVGQISQSYNYIGFKLGKYDAVNKVNKMEDGMKMSNKNLRLAMAHAIDKDAIANNLFKGLRLPATTVIPPSHKVYRDNETKGYEFDVEKAKKLLDDANYKDTNGDNFREDPNGKELKITFAARGGSASNEAYAKFILQSWEKIGLKVEFLDGRLHDSSKFYDMVEADDPKIDVYLAGWIVGSDPSPAGIWAKTAKFNYPRWTHDKNDELLQKINSPESADLNYRVEAFKEWQKLVQEEIPLFPLDNRYTLVGANARVKNYDLAADAKVGLHDLTVTSDKPEK
jgi:peptide/nickel transport system substrate-binding protein